jgi:hypothetical protein
MEEYLGRFHEFSDIQDARPRPLSDLEAGVIYGRHEARR